MREGAGGGRRGRRGAPPRERRAHRRALFVLAGLLFLAVAVAARGALGREGASDVIWHEPVQLAEGEAYQGPWRMNESDFRYVDAPSAALAEDGRIAAVWVDQARKAVLFQAYSADARPVLPDPTDVSRSPGVFSWLPRVALVPGAPDEVHVLWQEIVFSGGSHGGEAYYARSTDGGRSFSSPLNLSRTPAGAGKGRLTRERWDNGSLDLAVGAGGEVYVAWTEYEGALRFRRSGDGGRSFSEPVVVADEGRGGPARGPALAVGPGGGVYLAWTVGEDARADVHVARSRDGGRTWEEPRRAFRREGHADAPKLAVASDGVLHLAFGESAGGPFRASRVLYARSTDGGVSFEEPRQIGGGSGGVGAGFPHLALAPDGRVYVAWEMFPRAGRRPEGLGFATSGDGGETFSEPVVVPGTRGPELGFNGSLQGLLQSKLAVSPTGALALVNGTFNPGERSRVRLIRGEARGR